MAYTIKQLKELCWDRGIYPFKIQDTWGEGIKGKEYFTCQCARPRNVKLKISTFKWVCWDAMHFYGVLEVSRPSIKKDGSLATYGGYLGEDTELFKNARIEIELWRYITPYEKKKYADRYNLDLNVTHGWLSKKKLIKFAEEVFETRFIGNWHLVIDDKTI